MKAARCPRCGAAAEFSPRNKWRPFCSERCKMIDLGAWADEAYRLPAQDEDVSPEDEPNGQPRTKPPGS